MLPKLWGTFGRFPDRVRLEDVRNDREVVVQLPRTAAWSERTEIVPSGACCSRFCRPVLPVHEML